jgi:hypothetical protein
VVITRDESTLSKAGLEATRSLSCGRTMQLTKSTGGIADIRSYGCAECGLWTIEECRRTATAGERLPWDSMPA